MKRIAIVGALMFVFGLWVMVLSGLIESRRGLFLGVGCMFAGCVLMVVEQAAADRNKALTAKRDRL